MKRISLLLSFLLLLTCKSNKIILETVDTYRIAFYNVENLFDCEDNPQTLDDEFTPTGRNEWTNKRYEKKLGQINRVISGMDYPAIIGLSEVENSKVLADLCNELTKNSGISYGFKHFDSPDKRGIDCALLYRKKQFHSLAIDYIRIPFPEAISGEVDYTSRDILYVKGLIHKSDTLHCFVNHWPSRRAGLAKSEPRRMHVARYLKRYADSLFSINPNANLILMGDFNDEPDNRSITEILNTRSSSPSFYNLMDSLDRAQKGSYNYRGNWNMLDQFLVSPNLMQEKGLSASGGNIFDPEWLCFKHPRFGRSPNRTYGGPNYYGGFSDHFAIFFDLTAN